MNRRWLRGVLAGPLALAAACAVMSGAAVWIAPGEAGVNNLVIPIILFPLIWTAVFLYSCLDRHLLRAFAIVGLLLIVNAAVIAWHLIQ